MKIFLLGISGTDSGSDVGPWLQVENLDLTQDAVSQRTEIKSRQSGDGGLTGAPLPELVEEITECWSHVTASAGQGDLAVTQEPVDVVIIKVTPRLPLPVLQLAGQVHQLGGDLGPVVDEAGQLLGLAGVL